MAFLRLVREKAELVKKEVGISTSSPSKGSKEAASDGQGESSDNTSSDGTAYEATQSTPSGGQGTDAQGSVASPDRITLTTSSNDPSTTTPNTESSGPSVCGTISKTTPSSGSEPKLPLHKPHPLSLSMLSGRAALSALASTSDPLLEEGLAEGGRQEPVTNELRLLDTLTCSNEKEVGPDVPRGIDDDDLKSVKQQKLKAPEEATSEPPPLFVEQVAGDVSQ